MAGAEAMASTISGGKRKAHVFRHHFNFFQVRKTALAEKLDHLLHQHVGSGGAGGESDGFHAIQPTGIDVAIGIDQIRTRPQVAGHLHQAVGVRAVGRAHHQHQVCLAGHVLDRNLAVFGRVTDILGVRALDVREALLQGVDDVPGFVQAEGGLSEIGDAVRVGNLQRPDLLDAVDNLGNLRGLTEGADDFIVVEVADQD